MQLSISENKRELKEHGVYGFPFAISHEILSHYEKGTFLWHWHPEIELTLFVEGSMEYQINDRVYQVQKGDGLFCNSNALHSGNMIHGEEECEYISITFHPRLLYGFEESLLYEKYINPILMDENLMSIHFHQMDSWHMPIVQRLIAINQLYLEQEDSWEMQTVILLQQIMLLIYQNRNNVSAGHISDSTTFERVSIILSFIHQHYMEKITLEDIAETINICRSECCRFFKSSTGMPLFQYLNQYRIEQSLFLLTNTDFSVTEIAMQTGFATAGYFSKVFRKLMGCTPREYRERMKK